MFPRATREALVMADVIDAGWQVLRARCGRCGFNEWLENPGDQHRRRVPCPKCNEVADDTAAKES
jgi:ribosomal protein S27AE